MLDSRPRLTRPESPCPLASVVRTSLALDAKTEKSSGASPWSERSAAHQAVLGVRALRWSWRRW